jgi:hypothetical protein
MITQPVNVLLVTWGSFFRSVACERAAIAVDLPQDCTAQIADRLGKNGSAASQKNNGPQRTAGRRKSSD